MRCVINSFTPTVKCFFFRVMLLKTVDENLDQVLYYHSCYFKNFAFSTSRVMFFFFGKMHNPSFTARYILLDVALIWLSLVTTRYHISNFVGS